MPRLWITEYTGLAADGQGSPVPVPAEPSHTQVLDYGAPTLSRPFRPETVLVRIVGNADAFVSFGASPVCGVDSELIMARCEAFRRVRGGHCVAAFDGVTGT
jgi:hypothetical protein